MADVSIRATLTGFEEGKQQLAAYQAGLKQLESEIAKVQGSFTQAVSKNDFAAAQQLGKELAILNDRYKDLGVHVSRITPDVHGLTQQQKEQAAAAGSVAIEFDGVGRSLANLALSYAAPVVLAGKFLSIWKESNAIGREAELQNIKLGAILQATGMVAGFNATQLDKMANSMQEAFAIDSEKVKQAITVLLTFRNIQGEMFERALKLGADYARLYGGDIASATRLFGRSLDDPARGMGRLSFTLGRLHSDQEKLLKDLSDSGDLLGAQGKLAGIFEGKMSGVAKAIGESAVSAIDRFRNSWSEAMKELSKTSDDPTGAGGQWYSGLSKALDFFTKKQKELREEESRGLMNSYKADSENFNFSLEVRQSALQKYNVLRKSLGIKTEQEIAVERIRILTSTAVKDGELAKEAAKKRLEAQLRSIDAEIALGTKTAADKALLLRQAAAQEQITNEEKLNFLAQSAAAIKEGQKFTQAEIEATSQLNSVVSKGVQDHLSAQLALGILDKKRYEEAKTAEELRQNDIQQGLNLQKISLSEVWTLEHRNALVKQEQLKLERDIIKAKGDSAAEIARRAVSNEETKRLHEIVDLVEKTTKENDTQASSFFMQQSEKLKGLTDEIALIGKSKVQRDTIVALQKLDLEYNKAISGLVKENNKSYQEQFDLITATYEETKAKLPELIQANKDASDEITEFWKKAAQNIQSGMSDLFFDVMQGKLSDLGNRFKLALDRMVADVLAAKAATALFGVGFGKANEPIGGLVGQGIGWLGGAFGFGGGSTASMAAAAGNSGAMEGVLLGAFASGGSFTVGGAGGTDSQMVGFKATPGERVTVETPGQQRARGGINFNGPLVAVYANDPSAFNRSRGQMGAEMFVLAENFARRFR